MKTLEICCPDVSSVDAAYQAGADRVELCCALELDGLTPSVGLIKHALALKAQADTDSRRWNVNVLVRPRAGDFVYTPAEIEVMACDIQMAKSIGADGVVIGALTEDGDIDMDTMQSLMDAATGMSVTFHRAFDHGRQPERMLEDIISLGCNRLLTSGCAPSAPEGHAVLKQLVQQSAGRIVIMAGAGVRPENIAEIIASTGADEIHASAGGRLETMLQLRKLVK